MKIAIEGCLHGELNKIYETIEEIEKREGHKIDLLLCCGDFQSTRNFSDLKCMAVPDKYKEMGSFYQYYSGEKIAPVLTIFIGGNHEASNYLQELPYGGWVAPNIYYLGYAGVVKYQGIRIAGLSGIYKGIDYLKGHFESPPYDNSSMRSVYHIRNIETFRLRQLVTSPDIILSHDWPRGIHKFGNEVSLLRRKKHFKEDISRDQLGSRPSMEVLEALKPMYWFSAHLHVKFAALMEHDDGSMTKFLALDKCLPNRRFLQVLDIPTDSSDTNLQYDAEWLAILRSTNHLLNVEKIDKHMPGPLYPGRWDFKPSQNEIEEIVEIFGGKLEIPQNFEATVEPYNPNLHHKKLLWTVPVQKPQSNAQTNWLCSKLDIDDPIALLGSTMRKSEQSSVSVGEFSASAEYSSFNQDESSDYCQTGQLSGKETSLRMKRSFLDLPSPTTPTLQPDADDKPNQKSSQDLSLLTASAMKDQDDEVQERELNKDACFVIDKSQTVQESSQPLKKTLKRRNQAVYQSQDD